MPRMSSASEVCPRVSFESTCAIQKLTVHLLRYHTSSMAFSPELEARLGQAQGISRSSSQFHRLAGSDLSSCYRVD